MWERSPHETYLSMRLNILTLIGIQHLANVCQFLHANVYLTHVVRWAVSCRTPDALMVILMDPNPDVGSVNDSGTRPSAGVLSFFLGLPWVNSPTYFPAEICLVLILASEQIAETRSNRARTYMSGFFLLDPLFSLANLLPHSFESAHSFSCMFNCPMFGSRFVRDLGRLPFFGPRSNRVTLFFCLFL